MDYANGYHIDSHPAWFTDITHIQRGDTVRSNFRYVQSIVPSSAANFRTYNTSSHPPPVGDQCPVKITVAGSVTFDIPRGYLVYCSPYFRATFYGSFSEATTKTLSLPHVSADVFEAFTKWLIEGKPLAFHKKNRKKSAGNRRAQPQIGLYVSEDMILELYIFADAHIVPNLEREIIDIVYAIHIEDGIRVPDFNLISAVWDRLPVSSALLRLFVDLEAKYGYLLRPIEQLPTQGTRESHEHESQIQGPSPPEEFWTEVDRRRIRRILPNSLSGYFSVTFGIQGPLEKCDYHTHSALEEKTQVHSVTVWGLPPREKKDGRRKRSVSWP